MSRIVWITNARAIACLMVIALHCSAVYVTDVSGLATSEWMVANFIGSATRPCVPLFFMLSGYLFLGDRGPRVRNVVRILTALVFYSVLALLMRIWLGQDLRIANVVAIAVAPAYYHLWFFYALLPVYGLMSVLTIRDSGWTPLLVLTGGMTVLNPGIFDVLAVLGPRVGLASDAFLDGKLIYYFGYACIGACLRGALAVRAARGAVGWFAGYAVMTAVIVWITFIQSSDAGVLVGTFFSYTNPLVVLQSVFLLLALTGLGTRRRMFGALAQGSLAIYGLHAFVLDALRNAWGPSTLSVWVAMPLLFVVTLGVSLALAFGLSRIDRRNLFH